MFVYLCTYFKLTNFCRPKRTDYLNTLRIRSGVCKQHTERKDGDETGHTQVTAETVPVKEQEEHGILPLASLRLWEILRDLCLEEADGFMVDMDAWKKVDTSYFSNKKVLILYKFRDGWRKGFVKTFFSKAERVRREAFDF